MTRIRQISFWIVGISLWVAAGPGRVDRAWAQDDELGADALLDDPPASPAPAATPAATPAVTPANPGTPASARPVAAATPLTVRMPPPVVSGPTPTPTPTPEPTPAPPLPFERALRRVVHHARYVNEAAKRMTARYEYRASETLRSAFTGRGVHTSVVLAHAPAWAAAQVVPAWREAQPFYDRHRKLLEQSYRFLIARKQEQERSQTPQQRQQKKEFTVPGSEIEYIEKSMKAWRNQQAYVERDLDELVAAQANKALYLDRIEEVKAQRFGDIYAGRQTFQGQVDALGEQADQQQGRTDRLLKRLEDAGRDVTLMLALGDPNGTRVATAAQLHTAMFGSSPTTTASVPPPGDDDLPGGDSGGESDFDPTAAPAPGPTPAVTPRAIAPPPARATPAGPRPPGALPTPAATPAASGPMPENEITDVPE